MISRRALVPRLALAATGGAGLWLLRDRLPWPPLAVHFANGRDTPWQPLPPSGGLIEIPVTVNGTPLRAVVDSGAQFSAIDTALARQLGLRRPMTAPILAYGVSGGPVLTHTVRVNLAAPGLSAPNLRAAVLDLAPISAVTGRDFQMLIGRDVLGQLVVEADFPRARARFLAPGVYAPPRDAVTAPLRQSGGAPVIAIQVEAAEPVEVLVDTGSSSLLALSEAAARQAGLLAAGRPAQSAHSVSLGGLRLNRVVVARSVGIASVRIDNVAVQIYQPAPNAPAPSGLLGGGLFRRFRMALDLGGGWLHLVRPSPLVVSASFAG